KGSGRRTARDKRNCATHSPPLRADHQRNLAGPMRRLWKVRHQRHLGKTGEVLRPGVSAPPPTPPDAPSLSGMGPPRTVMNQKDRIFSLGIIKPGRRPARLWLALPATPPGACAAGLGRAPNDAPSNRTANPASAPLPCWSCPPGNTAPKALDISPA